MIPIIIGLIVVVGVFGFYSTAASSTNDSSPVSFESISDLVFSSYSINSKCEMYNAWIDVARDYDDLKDANMAFGGVTEAEIWEVLGKAQEKFYVEPCDNCGDLGPNVDPDLYQEYIWNLSLDIFTDKTMITNDINPELEEDVREFLNILNSKELVSVIHQASLVC